MAISPRMKALLRLATGLTLAFIYLPLIVIALYAFNERRTQTWPIPGWTLDWFEKAFHNPGVRDALWTSLKAGLGATAIAILLGSLAAAAVARYRFFGREVVSFLVILPIALPGIVTGMALNATFREVLEPFGVGLGLFTVIVGHATFCIVVIYNNVVARLRRTSRSFEEASADLGASTCRRCAPRSSRGRCSPSRSPSTRSSSPRSPPAASRRCRSGSSRTSRDRTSSRSSTWSACS